MAVNNILYFYVTTHFKWWKDAIEAIYVFDLDIEGVHTVGM